MRMSGVSDCVPVGNVLKEITIAGQKMIGGFRGYRWYWWGVLGSDRVRSLPGP
jgi:hypothetical protein